MNNKFFLVNVFNIVSALTRKTIADQLINIDTSIKTAYSKNNKTEDLKIKFKEYYIKNLLY